MQSPAPAAALPAFVPPPEDADLVKRITKLAEYYTRNGPAFELMLKEKQKENVEYAFLFGGEGAAFYAWCLFCMHRGLPYDKPLPEGFVDAAPQAAPAAATAIVAPVAAAVQAMPEEVTSGFATVLDLLNGSQVRHPMHHTSDTADFRNEAAEHARAQPSCALACMRRMYATAPPTQMYEGAWSCMVVTFGPTTPCAVCMHTDEVLAAHTQMNAEFITAKRSCAIPHHMISPDSQSVGRLRCTQHALLCAVPEMQ